jgi:hypothetical protein
MSRKRTFADDLVPYVDNVTNHVRIGNDVVKRARILSEKLAALHLSFSKDLLKLVNSERSMNLKNQDGSQGIRILWNSVLENLALVGESHADTSKEIHASVVEPLSQFENTIGNRAADDAEMMCKQLFNQIGTLEEHAVKAQTKAMKMLNSPEIVNFDDTKEDAPQGSSQLKGESVPNSGLRSKSLVKHDSKEILKSWISKNDPEKKKKRMKQTVEQCKVYKDLVAEVNKVKVKTRDEELPLVLRKLQDAEEVRFNLLKQTVGALSKSYSNIQNSLADFSSSSENIVSEMNFSEDCDSYISFCVSNAQKSNVNQVLEAINFDLPQSFEEIVQRLGGDIDVKLRSDLLYHVKQFGGSLDEIMELPENKGKEEQYIFLWLVKNIYDLNGTASEGIFRISANLNDIITIQDLLEKREYTNLESKVDSPNTSAELLKIWMRNLKDPIIPFALYQSCIDLANKQSMSSKELFLETPEKQEAFRKILDAIPQVNLRIIERLVRLALDISDNKLSLMDLSNLSIVLAPSFLRQTTKDPMLQLKTFKSESKFVEILCRNLDVSSIPAIELPAYNFSEFIPSDTVDDLNDGMPEADSEADPAKILESRAPVSPKVSSSKKKSIFERLSANK